MILIDSKMESRHLLATLPWKIQATLQQAWV